MKAAILLLALALVLEMVPIALACAFSYTHRGGLEPLNGRRLMEASLDGFRRAQCRWGAGCCAGSLACTEPKLAPDSSLLRSAGCEWCM